MDPGPGGSRQDDAARLDAARQEFDAQAQRFEQARTRLAATIDTIPARRVPARDPARFRVRPAAGQAGEHAGGRAGQGHLDSPAPVRAGRGIRPATPRFPARQRQDQRPSYTDSRADRRTGTRRQPPASPTHRKLTPLPSDHPGIITTGSTATEKPSPVGLAGFEPATSATQTRRASQTALQPVPTRV
jgi:hypothetical protein